MTSTERAALDAVDIKKISESISPTPSADYQEFCITQLYRFNYFQKLDGTGSIMLYENLVRNSEQQSIAW